MTHGLSFLPQCDQIVVMADGTITEVGSYSELVDNNAAFAEFLRNYASKEKEEEKREKAERQESGNSLVEASIIMRCMYVTMVTQ